MRIKFLAIGSRDDIYPYAALGQGLMAVGHQISFITTANFRNFIQEQGLDFYAIPGDAENLVKESGADAPALIWAFRNIAKGLITNAKQIILILSETDIILN